MRIQLPSFAPNAVALFIASVLFASCSSATNVTPSQGGGLGPNSNWAVHTVSGLLDESFVDSGKGGACPLIINGSGSTTGPYRGPNTATGIAKFPCPQNPSGKAFIHGKFKIKSGATTITGTFSGQGQGSCIDHACSANSNTLTYTAKIRNGRKVTTISGNAAGGVECAYGGLGQLAITLYSL